MPSDRLGIKRASRTSALRISSSRKTSTLANETLLFTGYGYIREDNRAPTRCFQNDQRNGCFPGIYESPFQAVPFFPRRGDRPGR
jgi:hypothetical protein